jgi:hypothetical protein
MIDWVRRRLSFANVISLIALFVALGGSSFAALTVTGKHVKNSSLTGKDVRNDSLTGRDVKNLHPDEIAGSPCVQRHGFPLAGSYGIGLEPLGYHLTALIKRWIK